METEERYGSLILPQTTREREFVRNQMEILAVGEPEACDEPYECERPHLCNPMHVVAPYYHPIDSRIKPQAWVLVEQASLIEADHDQKTYYVRIADIAAVFTDNTP